MTTDNLEKSGSLDFTLATFIFLLSEEGFQASDENISKACKALNKASNTAFVSRVAADISDLIMKSMGSSPSIEAVETFLQNNFSETQYSTESPPVLGANLVASIMSSIEGELTLDNVQNWFTKQLPDAKIAFGFKFLIQHVNAKNDPRRTRLVPHFILDNKKY